jgi:DNA-binding response OmpR family regulator
MIQLEEIDFSNVLDSPNLRPLEFVENDETFRIGNRKIELTPTESKLLLLLYQNQNRVVRNEDIVRHFYPETDDLEDQTSWITTAVFRLRQELGDNLYVRNIRKKGYQLVIDPLGEKKNNG